MKSMTITVRRATLAALFLLLSAGLSAQTEKPENEFTFANKLYEDGLYKLAGKQFREFAKRFPNEPRADEALLLSGKSFSAAHDYKSAFQSFKELELSYPRSGYLADGRFSLAECQRALGDNLAAAELFRRVPVLHPESDFAPRAFFQAGDAYARAGMIGKAVDAYLSLLKTYPDAPDNLAAHLQVVRLYLRSGDVDEALAHSDAIFATYGADMKDARVYLLRARIFEKLGQVREAERLFAALVADFPATREGAEAGLALARLLRARGDYAAALEKLGLVQKSAPADLSGSILLEKGNLLEATGKADEARAAYARGREVADATFLADLEAGEARLLFAEKNYAQAAELLRSAIAYSGERLSASPDSTTFVTRSQLLLIQALRLGQNPLEALEASRLFQRHFDKSRYLPDVLFEEARVYETSLNDYGKAIRKYENLVERFPASDLTDEAQFRLAVCYEKLHDFPVALAEHEKHLRRFPGTDLYAKVAHHIDAITATLPGTGDHSGRELASLFTRVASGNANDIDFMLGKVLLASKDFDGAIPHLRRAATRAPADSIRTEALLMLGNAFLLSAEKRWLLGDENARALRDSAVATRVALQPRGRDVAAMPGYQRFAVEVIESGRTDSVATQLERFIHELERDSTNVSAAVWTALARASAGDSLGCGAFTDYAEGSQSDDEASPELVFQEILCSRNSDPDSIRAEKLESFVQSFPASHLSPRALLLQAETKLALGDTSGCVAALEQVTAIYPYANVARQARLRLANLHFAAHDFRSAVDEYQRLRLLPREKLEAAGTASSFILFRLAQSLEGQGRLTEALTHYIDFVRTNPSSAESTSAMLAIARLCSREGKASLAREYYTSLSRSELKPDERYEALVGLADLAFDGRAYADALANYHEARNGLAAGPKRRYVDSRILRCQLSLKRFAVAEKGIKRFKSEYDDTKMDEAQFLEDKGQAYLANKNFELAEKAFKKLVKTGRGTDYAARGELGLGALYLVTNHTENALKLLTNLPSKYPRSKVTPRAYYNLGDFYFKSGQTNNAILAFKNTLSHPQAGEYYEKSMLYLIECYRGAQLWDQAIATTRRYLREFPRSRNALRKQVDLGQFLMKLKEYGRAIERFRNLQPFADKELQPELQFYIAQSYKESGNFEQAVTEYLKVKYLTAPTKLPWHVTALFESGRCLVRLNQFEAAKKVFRRILREQGENSNFGRFAAKQLQEIEARTTAGGQVSNSAPM